jgi:hypothetical protein
MIWTPTRQPLRRRHHLSSAAPTAALVSLTLLFGATACGDSDDTNGSSSAQSSTADEQAQAEAWADDVCSPLGDWKIAVDDARATLSDKANLSANEVRGAANGVADATDSLVSDLESLEPPDTTAGDEAQAALSTLSSQLQQHKDTITSATDQSSSTPREMLANVSTVTGALATMLTDVAAAVEDIGQLDGAEKLTSAFQDTPSCQQLQDDH